MLYDIPTALLVAVLLLAILVTVEAGIRVGQRHGQTTWANAHQVHTALTTATLALMGLMLAFAFNLSATRYETRKTLVVTEASSIQSVRTALDFLAPPARERADKLLSDYLDQRLVYMSVGHDWKREQRAIDLSRQLHRGLWQIAISTDSYAATEPQLRSAQYAELTQALLDLNNVARQREAARARLVPQAVLFLLFALAIGSGWVLAYISGASGHPDRLPTYVVLGLVCLIIYMIIDFDRPRRGLMQIDPGPLQDLVVR